MICFKCGEDRKTPHKYKNNRICHRCYLRTYKTPIKQCSNCNEYKNIVSREPLLCRSCYLKKYEIPKRKCIICKNIKQIHKNIKNGGICVSCYKKSYSIPKKKCLECGKIAILATKKFCYSCRNRERQKNDKNFDIRTRLRKRVSKNIKKMNRRNSLINYDAIINYLGYPPSDNYHIDHIFPLKAFDLTKENHIRAAFDPENHQWLTDRDNLIKRDFYNKDDFSKYLKKFE